MSSPVSAAPSPDAAIEKASIFGKGCAQVMLVQHDHMIEALAAYASKEALAGGIQCALPRYTVPAGQVPPGKLSLQPEALRAAQEATNELKHSEKRPQMFWGS